MEKALLIEDGEALCEIEKPALGSSTVPNSEVQISNPAHWFAVYTAPRHEKRIAEHFEMRGIESFLPLYRSPRRWKNGCTVEVQQPLFPSYIFVRISWEERVHVLEVPGVLQLVGTKSTLAVLTNFEIESLRSGLQLCKFEPHPYLVVGERVRIKAGPLAGMEGVLVRKKANLRVVITLDLIMQSVAVEVEADEVEACATHLFGTETSQLS